jgi:hypothetical protein
MMLDRLSALKATSVIQVQQAQRVIRVLLAQLDHKVILVNKVILDLQAQQEIRVQ